MSKDNTRESSSISVCPRSVKCIMRPISRLRMVRECVRAEKLASNSTCASPLGEVGGSTSSPAPS